MCMMKLGVASFFFLLLIFNLWEGESYHIDEGGHIKEFNI